MIRGVIFDLDGTLVQLPIRYDILQSKLKKMFNTTQDFKPLISDIVRRAENDDAKLRDAFELICREEIAAAENLSVIDGARDILQHFKSRSLAIGLVTMQCNDAARKILEKIHVADIFSSIITRDESHDRYEQIRKSLENLQLVPDEVLIVGDRLHDAESAKRAGCVPVLIKKNIDKKIDCRVFEKISDLATLEI